MIRFTFYCFVAALVGLTACGKSCADKIYSDQSTTTEPETPQLEPVALPPPGPGEGPRPAPREQRDPVVAWVNDVRIRRSQLEAQLRRRIDAYEAAGRETDPRWRDAQRRHIVRQLVQDEVLRQTVEREGIVIADETVQAALDAEIESTFHSTAQLELFLARRRIDRAAYLQSIRDELAVKELLARRGGAPPTLEDARAYYERFRENWQAPERVLAASIGVRLPRNPSPEEEAEAMERILGYREAALREGADFAELARAHSETPDRYRGGSMGWIFRDDAELQTAVMEALFALEVGEVSAPIRTRSGYQIVTISDHQPAGYRSFDEVREDIQAIVARRAEQAQRAAIAEEMEASFEVGYAVTSYGLEGEGEIRSEADEEPGRAFQGRARHARPGETPPGN